MELKTINLYSKNKPDCINFALAATNLIAVSTSKTPATTAATYSPILCPATLDETTPKLVNNSTRDNSNVKREICVYNV